MEALTDLSAEAADGGMATLITLGGGALFPSTGIRIEVSGFSKLLVAYVIELTARLQTVQTNFVLLLN